MRPIGAGIEPSAPLKLRHEPTDKVSPMNRKRTLIILGLVWLALVIGALAWGVGRQTDDLQTKAEDALAAAGIAATVDVDGRDATLSGRLSDAEQSRALELVRGITGIREVEWREPASASATTTLPPATTTTTTTTSGTTTPTSTTTTTTMPAATTTTVSASVARIGAGLEGGRLLLTGAIPDEAAAARTAVVADLIYFPFLDNQLATDSELDANSWVGRTADAISVLPIVSTAQLDVIGEEATLVASAPNAQTAAVLEGAVSRALGPEVTLSADIEVTGKDLPTYNATAPGDGTVTITGIMPDQAAVERIYQAAVNVYGADNVVNEMVIGDNTDATFSLFRIPLTFQQFAPIEEWVVNIENNVTSGRVRGGASFQFGSSELTPELVNLLDIAAGIMLRNPSLFMTIEGHTDSVGPDAFNQGLSEARARSGVDYLIAQGVPSDRLAGIGYGESNPIADNNTAAGREKNRRIEFVLGPPQGADN
jgi:outer membrane protein OmpA-like peptidoglycan-associated protein